MNAVRLIPIRPLVLAALVASFALSALPSAADAQPAQPGIWPSPTGQKPKDAPDEPGPEPEREPTPHEQAKAKYNEGVKAFGRREFVQALELFRESDDLYASPNSRLMIGKSLHGLGRWVDAYREMTAVEQQAAAAASARDDYIDTMNAAREMLSRLRAKVGLVRVSVVGGFESLPADARITVAGHEVAREVWSKPVAMEPGEARVALTTSEGTSDQVVTVAAGEDVAVALAVPAKETGNGDGAGADEDSRWFQDNRQTLAFIAGGVGVAGFLTFAVLGGMTLSSFGDLEDRCPNGDCPLGTQQDIDAGGAYQTGANVALVIGVVGAAACVTLFLLDPAITGSDDGGAEQASMPLSLHVGPTSLAMSLGW